jgi:hypothetical protein
MVRRSLAASLCIALLAIAGSAGAEEQNEVTDAERAELSRQQQSPLTEVMNFDVKTDVRMGIGETRENSLLVRISPLTPIRVAPGWKLVVWPTLPLRSLPPQSTSSDQRVNGMGDVLLRQLITPSMIGSFLWGIGPVAQLPTATQTETGTGRFSLGLVAVLGYRVGDVTLNVRPEHYRSIGGQTQREPVEATLFTPSISVTLPSSLSLGLLSETVVNWRAQGRDRWSVPVMLTVSDIADVSGLPVNVTVGAEYFALSPANGPSWSVRIAMAFLFRIRRKQESGGNE